MQVQTETYYIANDGQKFNTAEACLAHERDVLGEPQWIINILGEIGVRVKGVNYYCYKGESLQYKEEQVRWRFVGQRELGEALVCNEVAVAKAFANDTANSGEEYARLYQERLCKWASNFVWNDPDPVPSVESSAEAA